MTIKIRVENAKAVEAALLKYGEELETRVGALVQAVATNAMSDAKKAIKDGAKTGRIYRRGNIEHRASAPGESPANDTGTLINSIYYKQNTKLQATIGSRLNYAYYLEYGTFKMKPRPTWVFVSFSAAYVLNKEINNLLQRLKL